MKLLSLFSGIGAFEKALDRCKIEYELVNYCEIDKYAGKAYALIHGVEETMNLGDITKVDTSVFDGVDLVTYGFPCQDISNAGKQKGFEDENGERTRSGLFFEALRIIEDTQPKFAICENVKALVGKKFAKEFQTVLDSLDAAGYNNYWQVLNAKDYGIPQNRERVFVISIRKDIDHGFIFPEPFPLELRLKDVLEETVDEKYYLSDKMVDYVCATGTKDWSYEPEIDLEVARPLTATMHKGHRASTDNYVSELYANDGVKVSIEDGKPQIIQTGQIYPNSGNPQAGRIYEPNGISPSLDTCQGGNRMPKITEPICAASRGKNPKNPSDRTPGAPTVQRLEFNKNGTTNALTTVQKDNYIVEPAGEPKIVDDTYKGREPRVYEEFSPAIRAERTGFKVVEPFISVKEATTKGYAEAVEGDCVNLQFPNSKTRRGRVGKQIAQTLQCNDAMGVVVSEPNVLTPKRTEYGKAIRKQYEAGEIEESRHNMTVMVPRTDGIANTLTTVLKDNYVAEPNALEKILADGPLEEPVTTRGKDIASTIRSSIHKQGSRNLVENIKSGRGYEGIIEPAKKRQVRGFVKGTNHE